MKTRIAVLLIVLGLCLQAASCSSPGGGRYPNRRDSTDKIR